MDEDDYRRTMNEFALDPRGDKAYVQFYKDNPNMIRKAIFGRMPLIHILQYAKWNDYRIFKAVIELLNMGADPNTQAKDNGQYAGDLAYKQERIEVYEAIKKKGGRAPEGDRKEEDFNRQWKQKEQDDSDRGRLENKPETIAVGKMTIYNGGLVEREMQTVINGIKKVSERMKGLGFGHLLYGPVVVVAKEMPGKTYDVRVRKYKDFKADAFYYSNQDMLVVNADAFVRDVGNGMHTFAHELGHRQWYKFMGATERKWWRGEYEERGEKITPSVIKHIASVMEWATPKVRNAEGYTYHDWFDFDYNKFLEKMRQSQKKYKAVDALDVIAGMVESGSNKAKMRKNFVERLTAGMSQHAFTVERIAEYRKTGERGSLGRMRRLDDKGIDKEYEKAKKALIQKRDILLNLNRGSGEFIKVPSSTSDYGQSSDKEDYAEAFGYYIANKPMPAGIHDLFMSVSGLRKSSANPYLNTPPTELKRKLKTEKDKSKRKQMQTALNAWRTVVPGPFKKTGVDMKEASEILTMSRETLDEVHRILASEARKKFNLKKEYSRWNTKLFGGELPDIPLKWTRSKTVGGYVRTSYDRLTGEMTPLLLAISDYLQMDQQRFDEIMIHELIHVWQAVHNIRESGGNHGTEFKKKARELGNKVGFEITLTEDIGDLEASDAVKTKKFVVVLIKNRNGHMVFNTSNWNRKERLFREQLGRMVSLYNMDIEIYESDSRSLLKMGTKNNVVGKRGKISWYRSPSGFHKDIMSNGKELKKVGDAGRAEFDDSRPKGMLKGIGN